MRPVDPLTWQQVSPLLDRALDITHGDRAGFLADVRVQQPELAPILEDLLIEYGQLCRTEFLEFSPPAASPDLLPDSPYSLAGTVVGPYTLDVPLGVGGMGSVWHARRTDGRFEGAVAVKLLHLAALDAGGAERFQREGTLLARLSHPHIAKLFDAGVTSAGQPYLVLEYIRGEAIDQYANEHRLDVRARLDLFQQVAAAVAHAHAHSIVHRDLKPSNVLVDSEAQVKLLDFGIAKLVDADGPDADDARLTRTGSQAWTPAYAAPEQVRGEPATTATDVYTLGVLLYQLLVEVHPTSQGCTTAASYLQSIVEVDPIRPSVAVARAGAGAGAKADAARIASSRATTPDGLRQTLAGDLDNILGMALRKAPEHRYTSVTAFADDVRRYLRDQPVLARGDRWPYRAKKFLWRHRVPAAALAGVVITLAAATAIGVTWRRTASTPAPSGTSDRNSAMVTAAVPITSEAGEETWPSFSPDGKQLVFAWMPPQALGPHLAIKTIGPSAVVEITKGPGQDTMPVWSPDGQSIAFIRAFREPEMMSQVCVMPATGGPARVLHSERHISAGLAWWQQGNALLFATQPTRKEPFRIGALNLTTLRLTLLTSPQPAPLLATPGDRHPTVSPDGRTAAFVRETHDGEYVYLLDLMTRKERRLTFEPRPINGLTWQADGQAVILSAIQNGVDALYRAALADGRIVRLPQVDDWAKQPAVSAGGRLAFSRQQSDSNIYRADLRDTPGGRRDPRAIRAIRPIVASSRTDGAPQISPDGQRIVFESARSGGQDIWIAAADGAQPRQLTFLPRAAQPHWSPDGRRIGFGAEAPGQVRPDIWVVDASGGTPRQLTSDPSYDTMLAWSADGTSVYFRSDRSGAGWEVWRVPVEGGVPTRVTTGGGLRAQESRDGVFLYYSNDVPEIWRRTLRPAEQNAQDTRVMTLPRDAHWGGEWIAGERGIYYVNLQSASGAAIELMPFRPAGRARPIRILPLTAPPSGGAVFTIAPDESWLAWSQEDHRAGDILMIERVP
jgi:Tol biopolymer transport system component/serine/threonine protein kinase